MLAMKCLSRATCTLVVGLVCLGGQSSVLGTNLLVNGSFESFALPEDEWPTPGVGYDGVPVGSIWITGWTVIRGEIDYYQDRWQASDGARSLDLNGSPSLGGVSQSFATAPGVIYDVIFDMSGNPESFGGGPSLKELIIRADGQEAEFGYDVEDMGTTHSDMCWITYSFSFVADSDEATLEIFSSMPYATWTGPAIDDVRVVPEPASLVLLVTGSLFAARQRYHKR